MEAAAQRPGQLNIDALFNDYRMDRQQAFFWFEFLIASMVLAVELKNIIGYYRA